MIYKNSRSDYRICDKCGATLDAYETCDCATERVEPAEIRTRQAIRPAYSLNTLRKTGIEKVYCY